MLRFATAIKRLTERVLPMLLQSTRDSTIVESLLDLASFGGRQQGIHTNKIATRVALKFPA